MECSLQSGLRLWRLPALQRPPTVVTFPAPDDFSPLVIGRDHNGIACRLTVHDQFPTMMATLPLAIAFSSMVASPQRRRDRRPAFRRYLK